MIVKKKTSDLIIFIVTILILLISTPCFANESKKGIHVYEKWEIGNVPQQVLIRGDDISNPVLLYLHGGPGTPSIILEGILKDLEKHFTIATYDQRGAGKSFNKNIPVKSMNVDQFVEDAAEITQKILKLVNKKKLYLIGQSWGTMLGMFTVQKYPQLFHAYIAIGVLVDLVDNERLSYNFLINRASKLNRKFLIKKLSKITPPYINEDGQINYMQMYFQRKWLSKLGGASYNPENQVKTLKRLAKDSPYRKCGDLLKTIKGSLFSIKAMWPELVKHDLRKEVPKIDIPVYFCLGKYDFQTPYELGEQYFNILEAPQKKLIWFEKSGHLLITEEKEKFYNLLLNTVLKQPKQ